MRLSLKIAFRVVLGAVLFRAGYELSRSGGQNTYQQPATRYDCEDNSDTTKGHYKGVLTHCVPVKITRTM